MRLTTLFVELWFMPGWKCGGTTPLHPSSLPARRGKLGKLGKRAKHYGLRKFERPPTVKRIAATLVLALALLAVWPVYGQTVTLGDAAIESADDNGNGNLVLAQEATLAQSATLQSLSFYVTQPSGSLLLGLYDASGPSGHPGKLLAATAGFATAAGWNTANVAAPVSLAAGNYWLAYLPSSGNLGFRKQNNSGNCVLAGRTYSNGLPATFATSPSGCTPTTWSLYATLSASPPPATMHYTLKYTLTGLDLLPYPLFNVADSTANGTSVFFASQPVTVYLGQYASLAACQAYVPPANPSFTFGYVDPSSGMVVDVTFLSGGNMTATNGGCTDVNFK